jgi:hypothetical protein
MALQQPLVGLMDEPFEKGSSAGRKAAGYRICNCFHVNKFIELLRRPWAPAVVGLLLDGNPTLKPLLWRFLAAT